MNSDLEKNSVKDLFIKLSIPAIIAQLVNIAYNIVDRIYIGRIEDIGPIALTGIGVTMPIIVIIQAFSVLIGMGGAPKAAIALGAQNKKGAKKILMTSSILLVTIGLILTGLVFLFKDPVLYLFGASEKSYTYANEYLSIYIFGSVFIMIATGLNSFITTQGFAKDAMFTVLIGAVLNIVLDPIFIFAFAMGVSGAALATVISQAVSALWVVKVLLNKDLEIHFDLSLYKMDAKLVMSIISLGLSPFIMQLTESILQITFNRSLLAYGGDIYVAAMTIIGTLMQVLTLPLMGLTQGAQPITSYNYGAGNFLRLKESVKLLSKASFIYALCYNILIMVMPEIFVGIFTNDPDLIEVTSRYLRVYMAGTILFSLQISAQQSFIALSEARYSIFFASLRKIILLIPLIFILPKIMEAKVFAVFLAEPIADIIAAIATYTTFVYFLRKLKVKMA